jgi:hypothetical protein
MGAFFGVLSNGNSQIAKLTLDKLVLVCYTEIIQDLPYLHPPFSYCQPIVENQLLSNA